MRVKKTLLLVVVAVTGIYLGGCANLPGLQTIPLGNDRLSSLHTVSIDKNIPKPKTVPLGRSGANLGNMGLVAQVAIQVATADPQKDRPDTLNELLEREGIDVSQIVYSEAATQLSEKKGLLISDAPGADATFHFAVNRFVFSRTNPLGNVYNVTIAMTGKAYSKSNELIWIYTDYVTGMTSDNNQGQSEDTYYSDPSKLKLAIETACKALLNRMMSTIGNG